MLAVGQAGNDVARQQSPIGVLERDRALDQLAEGANDHVEPLPTERQVGELTVDLDRTPQVGILRVDDPLQDRGHDLQVRNVLRDTDQGNAKFIGLPQHVVGDLRQITLGLDDQARRPDRGQIAHQVSLCREVVFDGKRHRQQELAFGEPADRFRGFQHFDPGDRAVEAFGPRQHLSPLQSPQRHRFPDGQRHGNDKYASIAPRREAPKEPRTFGWFDQ